MALAHMSTDPESDVSAASQSAKERASKIYAVPVVIAKGRQIGPVAETRETTVGRLKIEMVRVPAGMFLMGSRADDRDAANDQCPQHAVHVEDYWIAKTPVTIQQFALFR